MHMEPLLLQPEKKVYSTLKKWGPFVIIAGTFIWQRWGVIHNPFMLNPDEADLLVAGKLAAQSLLPYDTFTTTTYGPVWPIFLGLLSTLKFPLHLLGAHLLSAIFTLLILGSWYWLLDRVSNRSTAIAATASVSLMLGNGGIPDTSTADFFHMSSELLPAALLSIASVLFLFSKKTSVTWRYLALALFTLGFLSKYQFGPTSVISIILIMLLPPEGVKIPLQAGKDVAAALAPLILLLATVLLSGRANYLVNEGIAVITNYVGTEDVSFLGRLREVLFFILQHPLFLIPLLITFSVAQNQHEKNFKNLIPMFSPLIYFFVALYSISKSPNLFPHYLYIILLSGIVPLAFMERDIRYEHECLNIRKKNRPIPNPRILLIPVALWALARTTPIPTIPIWLIIIIFVICIMLMTDVKRNLLLINFLRPSTRLSFFMLSISIIFLSSTWPTSSSFSTQSTSTEIISQDGGRLPADGISSNCPFGSTALVWGWSAELYSYYGLQPISRYTINNWQINPSPHQEFYKTELINELNSNPPRCIINAVGPGFFGYTDRSLHDISIVMEDISNLLQSTYTAVEVSFNNQTVLLYRKND
jgi:hypothetical protein